MPAWRIEHRSGDVAAFHSRPVEASRSATFFAADSPTLVLGSSQRDASIDARQAERLGIDVVRRRSGGGGVLLLPGEHVWLDLEIPRGDELWDDDIGRSMWWVGELWCAALEPFVPSATVHRGRLQPSPWSSSVCFAGVGPGEVLIAGVKLVGISQRRVRDAARFQSLVHLTWRPDVVTALVAEPRPEALLDAVATCSASAATIVDRLTAALSPR